MEPVNLKKYPRTPHLEGSRLQPGDEDLSQIPFSCIQGKHLVVEEKVDGANSAISFDEDGTLLLQSRGHYLIGGYRERHYNLMKQWAGIHQDAFFEVLGTRYILYGEWLYAKHTVYYDKLPHYFLEFDIFDQQEEIFLSTARRHEMLQGLPGFPFRFWRRESSRRKRNWFLCWGLPTISAIERRKPCVRPVRNWVWTRTASAGRPMTRI